MPTIKRFEDLVIWQLARRQCQVVSDLMEDGRFDFDAPLRDQINHSSASIMDNIAEGFDRFSRADFRRFLVVARGSAAEVRSQFYRAQDRRYLTAEEADKLIYEAGSLGTRITNLINHISRSEHKTKPTPPSATEPEVDYSIQPSYDLPNDQLSLER